MFDRIAVILNKILARSQLEESESEESQPEEAKASIVFDRELFYQMHATLTSELPAVKIKNNFLQRKMAEYFRKRKVSKNRLILAIIANIRLNI